MAEAHDHSHEHGHIHCHEHADEHCAAADDPHHAVHRIELALGKHFT